MVCKDEVKDIFLELEQKDRDRKQNRELRKLKDQLWRFNNQFQKERKQTENGGNEIIKEIVQR